MAEHEVEPVGRSPRSGAIPWVNEMVADALDRVGALLQAQHANPYRVAAYHRGAGVLRSLERDVDELLRGEGEEALIALPGIGRQLAAAVVELTATGRLRLLERLEGEVSPEDLFASIPGVGEALAHRIHQNLHVETLEELELAAHDGRLGAVPGFGPRRLRAIRAQLDELLRSSTRRRARLGRRAHEPPPVLPEVADVLAVDKAYRARARTGRLSCIAPRRFNPAASAWLPIWHVERGAWSYTVMYSNTARAHRLGKTADWVVVVFERDGHEGQCTVVTEHRGPDEGRRVIRGRELACRAHYEAAGEPAAAARPRTQVEGAARVLRALAAAVR